MRQKTKQKQNEDVILTLIDWLYNENDQMEPFTRLHDINELVNSQIGE